MPFPKWKSKRLFLRSLIYLKHTKKIGTKNPNQVTRLNRIIILTQLLFF